MALILTLLFALLTLVGISLEKTYKHIPPRELKRRARSGDELAKTLYKAAVYGVSLHILLIVFVGLSTAAFMVIFARSFSPWLAFVGAVLLLWVGYGWMPKARAGSMSLAIAKYLAPPIGWLLQKLHPLINWIIDLITRNR